MSSITGVSSGSSAWSSMGAISSSRAQMREKLFSKVDSDSSGSVDATELQSMLDDIAKHTGTSSSTSAADALKSLDSNGDGSLDADELLDQGTKSLMPEPPSTMAFAQARSAGGMQGAGGPPPPPPSDDTSSDASSTSSTSATSYDPLDTNQDGTVSAEERAAGEAKKAMQALLKAVDTDGDKQISDSEFSKFEDMLSAAVQEAGSTSSSGNSSSTDSQGSQQFTLTQLADLVIKQYAKTATNSVSQSSGSSLNVTA
ncbi:MAG: hypothetical protein ACOYNB_13255 [Aquabacterium sp.]|uniref:hypothetical protein n=1 Tax=Aquabacterium sp. TaxID=1872578 RepID=UPI003BE2EFF2